MRSFRSKPIGWRGESHRHYLAAKGIKTKYFTDKEDFERKLADQLAMERFDKDRLHKIGSGTDRVVFALESGEVLKVAKTRRGLQQNQQENDYFTGTEPKYEGKDFVVVEGADKPTPSTKRMLKELGRFNQDDFDRKTHDVVELMSHYGLEDYTNYDLAWGDFIRPSSWGEIRGEPVLVDKGSLNLGALRSAEPWADKEWADIKSQKRALKREGRERLFAEKVRL